MSIYKKYILEYPIKSNPRILYEFISTSGGLSKWFADSVVEHDNTFIFKWNQSSQKAFILKRRENELVKMRWEEDENEKFFEIRIDVDALTNDVMLLITDHCEESEYKEAKMLWDNLMHKLHRCIGSPE